MKCQSFIKFLLFGCCLMALLLLSCGSLKKQRITREIILTKTLDTTVKVNLYTGLEKVNVPIKDTAIIETKTVRAKSYINQKTGKIHLEVQGKEFDVPVKINEKKVIKEKEKHIEKQPFIFPVWLKIPIISGIYILIILILLKIRKWLNNRFS